VADPGTRILVVDDSPTIRRVVSSVLARAGHEVLAAETGEDGIAETIAQRPDMLLLDYSMPSMNGHGFLLGLREKDPDGPLVPVVLMCTRSDQIDATPGLQTALRQLGVVDTITKPFSPEALLAIVAHSVDRHGERPPASDRTRVAPGGGLSASDSQPSATRRDLAQRPFSVSAIRSSRDARALSEDGGAALSQPSQPSQPSGAASLLAAPAPTQRIAVTPEASAEPPPSLPAGVAFLGDLSLLALPEVLQLLKFQSHTGLLQVETSGLRFDVALDAGEIVAMKVAAPGDPATGRKTDHERGDLLLGRYFVAAGLIDEPALEAILADGRPANDKRPIGERLVAKGLVSPAQLRRAVGEQAQDLMVEILRAHRGTFLLRPGRALLPPVVVSPGWSVDLLLFDALRCIDEWGVIEREVPSFHACFDLVGGERRAEDPANAGLSEDELSMLRLFGGGPITVREAVKRSHLRAFDVCRVLYRLAVLKRLRRVDDGDERHLLDDHSAPATPLLSILPREAL
jgi:CheY-like chemotaxis protein